MTSKILAIGILTLINSIVFAGPQNRHGGNDLILNLTGKGEMYPSTVPDIDGDGVDDPAMCFDVKLVNMKNGWVTGKATDCLSNVTPNNAGVALVGTTYFHMRSGTLITRGNTSVQPVLHPTTTPSGQNITHITGAASNENSIIGGTGRFKNRTGKVRLSGMVDMSEFAGNKGEPIVFDCIFTIKLDWRKWP